MDDVIVTSIFQRAKEGFTGAAIVVTAEDIRNLTTDNILTALASIDPSFKINVSSLSGSNPTAIPDYQMRGQASIDGRHSHAEG